MSGSENLREQVRRARAKFIAMAATYTLGVLNDNFFKQAAMLLAVGAGQGEFQGRATVMYSAPFLIFAAHAGWMADRFSKRKVVIGAKILELAAMIFGAVSLCTGHLTLALVMLALMGVQATIFSPSLNGSIPELYPAEYVTRANAVLKALVTGAILIGIALAGFVLSVPGPTLLGVSFGRLLVAVVVILLAALGLLTALGVPSRSAAAPDKPFPWTGPLDTLRELYETFKDPLLAFVIAMDVFIWFAGTVQVLLINQMGLVQLKLSEAWTSGLVIAELLGLAVGGLIISRVVSGERWYRILSPAAIVMSVPMMLIAALPSLSGPLRLVPFFVTIGLVGVAGGAILVPCESFIQTRPAPDKKGAVIAAANFAAFAGILLSGPAANALNARYDPTDSFLRLGLLSLAVGLAARLLLRRGRLR